MSAGIRAYPSSNGGAKCALAFSLVLAIAVLTAPVPSFAQDSPAQRPTELRQLEDKEYADAQQAADAADRLRATFEARYSWHPSSPAKPSSEEVRQDAERVIAAYTLVANSYPHTEIAARSGIRLSGFYQYLGQTARALDKAKEIATDYQGTEYAPRAILAVGLLYSQAAHNPTAAKEWLSKIPRPNTDSVVAEPAYDEQEKLYLAAQQQIAHCDLVMGRRDAARERFDRLAERYPMYRDAIQREYEVQAATALHPALRIVDEIIEQSIASARTTTVPPARVSHVTESPSPIVSPRPALAADTPVALSDKSSAGRHWAGWSLLLVGIVLCASGVMYGLRTQ